jgi:hypothetical protein
LASQDAIEARRVEKREGKLPKFTGNGTRKISLD